MQSEQQSCYDAARFDNPLTEKKPKVVKPGRVEKIITPVDPDDPEKTQIAVPDADELYREIPH